MNVFKAAVFFVLAAVAVILLVFLLVDRPPAPPEVEVVEPEVPRERAPEPELTTSILLSKAEALEFYQRLESRISGYQTVKTRTRVQFPKILPDQPMESEFWFDAIKPAPFILRIFSAERIDGKDVTSDWEVVPNATEWSDGKTFKMVSFKRRNVHTVDLSAQDKPTQQVIQPTIRKCGEHYADPIQDLMFGIVYADRMKEFLEARREKTSEGDRVIVRMRINHAMAEAMKSNRLFIHLPVTKAAVEHVMLREDVFDPESGELLKTVYLDREQDPYIVQTYLEVEWNGEIPEDRFVVEEPPNARRHDVTAKLRRNHAWNLRPEDAFPHLQGLNPDVGDQEVEAVVERELVNDAPPAE